MPADLFHEAYTMLTLRSSPTTPFGRKVQMAIIVAGLADRVHVQNADVLDPADSLRQQNPLGKIPTLILEDGSALYDSRVIAEYIDHMAGGNRLIPEGAKARFDTLRLQALADGIAEAGVLRIYETRFREPEHHSEKWLAHQAGKMQAALLVLENSTLPAPDPQPDIGFIALASALGYLDLRFSSWRGDHPKLAAWLDAFAKAVPAFDATRPAT
jgi:glutathione S-transferase